MAEQFVEFTLQPEKDASYHLGLCRRILKVVAAEQPSQRKFAMWLRDNQVYDRALLQFLLKLCDVKLARTATLGDVGEDLAKRSEKGVDMPSMPEVPKTRSGVPKVDQDDNPDFGPVGGGPAPAPAPGAAAAAAAAEGKNPFYEAIFDRFVELNGYLVRFVFVGIGDGYLAPNEIVKRIGSAIYHGVRPLPGQFSAWVKWMEWLGYLKTVGFRQKLTDLGIESWKYLKEIPEDELLEKGTLGILAGLTQDEKDEGAPGDTRAFVTAEELGTDKATGPVPVARPPGMTAEDELVPEEEAADEGADFGPKGATPPLAPPGEDEEEAPPARPAAKAQAGKAPAPAKKPPPEDTGPSEEEEEAIRDLFGAEAAEQDKKAAKPLPPPPPPRPPPPPPAPALPPKPALSKVEGAAAAKPRPATPARVEAAVAKLDAAKAPPAAATAAAAEPFDAAESLSSEALDKRLAALTAEIGEIATEVTDEEAAEILAAAGDGEDDDVETPPPAKPVAVIARRDESIIGERTPTERFLKRPGTIELPDPPRDEMVAALAAPPLKDDQVDILAAQWEASPGRRPLSARDLAIDPQSMGGGEERKALVLFKLTAAALVLESSDAFGHKLALIRDLDRVRAVENMFTLDWSLDRALDAIGLLDGGRDLGASEERLVHLARLKRALATGGATIVRRVESAIGRRAAAIRAVCGSALGAGAYWVEREMRRLGLW